MQTESKYPEIQTLKALSDEERWSDLESILSGFDENSKCPSWVYFFLGQAQKGLGKYEEAVRSIKLGLVMNPDAAWAHIILFDANLKLEKKQEAYETLLKYIDKGDDCGDAAKISFISNAVTDGLFASAAQVNEIRSPIQKMKSFRIPRYAVAVQCFNKEDTFDKALAALVECTGSENFSLFILQDSAKSSKKEAVYSKEAEKVRLTIGKWMPKLMEKFSKVEILVNAQNLGTAPSCRRLLDEVSEKYDGFLFLEDDCVLSRDALEWTHYVLQNQISTYGNWFGTCESIFFDSKSVVPPSVTLDTLKGYANSVPVLSSYVLLDFVPSTCFITTKEVWKICSQIRSFVKGPESLTAFTSSIKRKTIAPVVPRASDIGMLHEFGYSVSNLGRGQVKEIKNTYVMSNPKEKIHCYDLYSGNLDLLYSASVRLHHKSVEKLNLSAVMAVNSN